MSAKRISINKAISELPEIELRINLEKSIDSNKE